MAIDEAANDEENVDDEQQIENKNLDQSISEEMMVDLQSVLNDLDSYRNDEKRIQQLIIELYAIYKEGIETPHPQLLETVKFYLKDRKNHEILKAFNDHAFPDNNQVK